MTVKMPIKKSIPLIREEIMELILKEFKPNEQGIEGLKKRFAHLEEFDFMQLVQVIYDEGRKDGLRQSLEVLK